ncbi:Transcription factor [Vigna angularis]|uniref:Transcription factor n=1 Tax=Phaseolus angularis TaxID=3914 RepID=A0A8T0KNC3_PHAAN|nr:Transcription factor [Vigna angularis]
MGCQPLEKGKPKHKKGLWSPEEDNKLRNYILKQGHGCWSSVPIKAGRTDNEIKNYWHSYLKKKEAKAKEMDSHNQIKYASSSSDTMESSNSLKNLATQGTQSCNFTKEASQSSLPKLLFAEWLSLDQVNSANSVDSFGLRNGFDQNSTLQEAAIHDMSDIPFGGGYHRCLANISAPEILNSELKYANQMAENGFIHCVPGVDLMSSNFSMSNDAIMYI